MVVVIEDKPKQAVEPVQLEQPVQPVQPVQPEQPVQPAQPMQPEQPVQPEDKPKQPHKITVKHFSRVKPNQTFIEVRAIERPRTHPKPPKGSMPVISNRQFGPLPPIETASTNEEGICDVDIPRRVTVYRKTPRNVFVRQRDFIVKTIVKRKVQNINISNNPYKKRPCRTENICGQFKYRVDKEPLKPILVRIKKCMGWQEDIYSIHGNATINNNGSGLMFFKGCQDLAQAQTLAGDLGITRKDIVVHMVVFSACIGHLVDVSPMGLVETVLVRMGLKTYRVMDTSNSVRFSIPKHDWLAVVYPSIIIRMTWDALTWTREIEDSIVTTCNKYIDEIVSQIADVKLG
jgi:hypothetical protein